MILVRTTLNVLPEKLLEIKQTLLSLIMPTGEEPGCISCSAYCDIRDKNRFIQIEEWESQKDFDNHIKTIRFGVLLGTKTLLSEPPGIQIHKVSQIQGMEAIQAARKK